jgi:hypothetical protein
VAVAGAVAVGAAVVGAAVAGAAVAGAAVAGAAVVGAARAFRADRVDHGVVTAGGATTGHSRILAPGAVRLAARTVCLADHAAGLTAACVMVDYMVVFTATGPAGHTVPTVPTAVPAGHTAPLGPVGRACCP